MWIVVLVIAFVQAAAVGVYAYRKARHVNDDVIAQFELLKDEVQQKRDLWAKVEVLQQELAADSDLRKVAQEFLDCREALRFERGRATITQAELEALEVRMRELDEIGRELEVSQTETKEELKILRRKEEDMRTKNESLRGQIEDSLSKMDVLMAEIEMTAQMQNQVAEMKSEFLRSQEKIQTMLNHIQQSNEQYFNLKRRYDALDVEYAQLCQQITERAQRA